MSVRSWLESIINENRVRPNRAMRRKLQKNSSRQVDYQRLEDRRLLADTSVVLNITPQGNISLVITDIGTSSNDDITLSYADGYYTFSDSSLTFESSISGAVGSGTSTLIIPDPDFTDLGVPINFTFDTGAGDDTITINSVKSETLEDGDPVSLGNFTILGGQGNDTVNLNADFAFANEHAPLFEGDANLQVDLTDGAASGDEDQIYLGANANISLQGTGTATLKASRNIALASGSSITTVDGGITLEANQQETPTSGNFYGILLNGATIETSGTGDILLKGRGGDDALSVSNRGVSVIFSTIRSTMSTTNGPAAGTITINGSGGVGTSNIYGMELVGTNARITSVDGDISITGVGGSGTANTNLGVLVSAGKITSTGDANISIVGTGDLSGAGNFNDGIRMQAGASILATNGNVVLSGVEGVGSSSPAVRLGVDTSVTSTNGNVSLAGDDLLILSSVTAANGGVTLRPLTAGTEIDLGTDTAGKLGLTDAELNWIAANRFVVGSHEAGDITFSQPINLANSDSLKIVTSGTVNDTGSTTVFTNLGLVVDAVGGVGTTGPLNIAVSNFEAHGGSGGVQVSNSGDLTINGSGVTVDSGSVSLAASDSITVNEAVSTVGGDILLSAISGIVLNDALSSSGGEVSLSADADADGSGTLSLPANNSWSEVHQLTASDGAVSDYFGTSVSFSSDGNTAIVGADGDFGGSAYVFTRNGNIWNQQRLTASDAQLGARFGTSVSLSSDGKTAIVGADGADPNQNAELDRGAAYIFTLFDNNWSQQRKLIASDGAASDNFGISVALSSDGDTAIVGSNLDNTGRAHVFTYNGTEWINNLLNNPDPAANDQFGISVALSSDGNTAIVGAHRDDVGGNVDQGSAYVFTRNGINWVEQTKLTANDGGEFDQFGYSVSLSNDGNRAIVGSHNDGLAQGAAYVFTRSGSDWNQEQKLTASDGAAHNQFGFSVSISGDGNTAIVGSHFDDVGGNTEQGSATTFSLLQPDGSIDAGTGTINVAAANVDHQKGLIQTTGLVTIAPEQSDRQITLGANASGTLGLTLAELDRITAGTINFGDTNSGDIEVSAPLARDYNLLLTTGGSIVVYQAITMASDKSFSADSVGSFYLHTTANISTAGSGTVDVTTQRNITLVSGSSITTVNGAITLAANQQATPTSGDFDGILINGGATIETSGTGDILLAGRGGDDASSASNNGVVIAAFGSVHSTMTGASAGAITIDGTGGAGTSNNYGVDFGGANARIDSVDGDISITGVAGTGSADTNLGVLLSVGEIVSTGTGNISIVGTGDLSGTGNFNDGIRMQDAASVLATDGNVELNGVEGVGSSSPAVRLGVDTSVTSTNGNVSLAGNDLLILSSVTAANGGVTLRPLTVGTEIDLGTDTAGKLGLTDAELNWITANRFVVGSYEAGDITFSQPINLANSDTLKIVTSGTVNDTGSTTVFTNLGLVVDAVGGVGTTGPLNIAVSNFEAHGGSGGVQVSNSGDLTINGSGVTVDSGNVSLAASGSITVNEEVSTGGGSILMSANSGIVLNDALSSSGGDVSLRADADGDGSGTLTLSQSDSWSEQQQLTAGDGAAGDDFGTSVSLSSDGNTAIVGSWLDDVGGNINQGSAYVFTRIGSHWNQQQLTASDGAGSDYFGTSVFLSSDGNTAIVGADRDNIGGNNDQGSAYVFTRSGNNWIEQKLTASDGAGNDFFGTSVALSSDGNTAIVGSRGDDIGSNSNQGSAYVFTRSGNNWIEQKLTASDGESFDTFGYSVSLSSDGNTAIVGAYGDFAGSAYVFTHDGNNWVEHTKLTASDGEFNDNFGISVSLSGDGNTAIVGAWADDDYQGSAYVFALSGNNWSEQQQLTAGDGAAGDYFGYSVSLSNDGNTAIVGSDRDDAGFNNQGSAYVFTRNGGAWNQQQQLNASDGASNDRFGRAVSLSGDGNTAIVGSYRDDVNDNNNQGSATTFSLTVGSIVAGTGTINMAASDVDLQLGMIQSTGTVSIAPEQSDRQIDLGSNASGRLALTDAELDRISAGTINIGDANSGAITFTGNIDRLTDTNFNLTTDDNDISLGTFSLDAVGGNVVFTTSGNGAITTGDNVGTDITASSLTLTTGAGVGTASLPLLTQVANLNADGGTGGVFVSNTGDLTIDGSGVSADVDIDISAASDITVAADIISGASNVSLAATETISVTSGTSITTSGAGAVSLTTPRNISLASGSSITTVDGGITLSANQQETPTSGDFYGILVNGATIETSGTGDILLAGRGGDDALSVSNRGVTLVFANIQSTMSGPSAGTITINGTGGVGTSNTYGVEFAGTGSRIESVDSDISITGIAGNGSADTNLGVLLSVGEITSTGTGNISIAGTGDLSGTGNFNDGIRMQAAASILTTDGNVELSGVEGVGSSSPSVRLGVDTSVTSTNGNVSLAGDDLLILSSVTAANGGVTLRPLTAGTEIDLGTDAAGKLGLTDAELDWITARSITIGDATTGDVTITGPVNPANADTLEIISSGQIGDANTTGADVTVADLILDGNVAPGQSVGNLQVDGDVTFAAGDTFTVEIDGTAGAGMTGGHDLLQVDGDNRTITLNDAELVITLNTAPPIGSDQIYRIVDSTGTGSAIAGLFNFGGNPLNDGDEFTVDNTIFRINYLVDGDVILTEAGNNVPVATENTNTLAEGEVAPATGNVITDDDGFGVDSDPDASDILSVSEIDGETDEANDVVGLYGTLDWASDGSYSYTIDNSNPAVQALAVGETLSDAFTYTVNDGNGGTDTATLTITINGTNDTPTATANTNAIAEDDIVAATGNLLTDDDSFGIDSDPDASDILSVGEIDGETDEANDVVGLYGSLDWAADGSYNYTIDNGNAAVQALAVGATLSDVFNYTISDSNGGFDSAALTITINGTNDAPVANDDFDTTGEDMPATVDVLDNDEDIDVGDTLTVLSVTQGANGLVTNNGTDVTYLPDADFNGTDTFTYTVMDVHGDTETGTVTITVTAVDDVVDDAFTTDNETAVTDDVSTNDTHAGVVTFTLNNDASNGNVTDNGSGGFTYTPNANFSGTDTFTYNAMDVNGDTEIGTVTITVFVLGDANDDGIFSNLDIAPFVMALTDPIAYAAAYPDVDPDCVLDMNNDGEFSNLDIADFVAALTGGGRNLVSGDSNDAGKYSVVVSESNIRGSDRLTNDTKVNVGDVADTGLYKKKEAKRNKVQRHVLEVAGAGQLDDNGRPTRTQTLLPRNPVIDAGGADYSKPLAAEQRANSRIEDRDHEVRDRIDHSAFELAADEFFTSLMLGDANNDGVFNKLEETLRSVKGG